MAFRDRTQLFKQLRTQPNFKSSGTQPTSSLTLSLKPDSNSSSSFNLLGEDEGLGSDIYELEAMGLNLSTQTEQVPQRELKPLNRPGAYQIIDMVDQIPDWVDICDEVNAEIASIQSNLSTLDSLHRKRLLPGFIDRTAEERAIADLATTLFGQLQRCHHLTRQLGQAKVQNEASIIVRNAQISLATRLQELSTQLQTRQASYLQKLRAREKHGFNGAAGLTKLPSEGLPVEGQPPLQLVQEELGTWELELIERREREIATISDSIQQLADLFRSLQTMVIDQGTLLDRIDYNVESVAENVKRATDELQAAVALSRSNASKGCILVLVVLIVAMVLLILLKAILRR